MSFYYYKSFAMMMIVALMITGISVANAEKNPDKKYAYPSGQIKHIEQSVSNENMIPYKPGYSTQADNFVTIDSVSNMWSYLYIMTNRAFVYDKTTGNLITIKRGYFNPAKPEHSGYTGANRSYNILMRMSEDDGTTWLDEVVMYDKDDIGYYEARYPSCFGFKMDNKQYVASTFPVIDYYPNGTSDWYGFVSTLWNPDIASSSEIPMNAYINLDFEGLALNWATDSKVVAGEKPNAPGEYFWVTASEMTSENENDFLNASHIGLRRTEDIEGETLETIPPAWNSDQFSVVDQAGSRFNQVIDLKMSDDGILYLGVYGNFYKEVGEKDANTVAISTSTDYGLTWSKFEQLPVAEREAYVSSLGFSGGSFVFNYTTKGLVVFNEGDFSFVVHGGVYDAAQAYQGSKVVEIYKSGGDWGMRTVADIAGAYITYRDILNTTDNTRMNPSDIELMAARTVDGSALVAKWIDLEDYDSEAGTFSTTDVYMAARDKNATKWSDKENVTKSDEIDRSVLIPDYIKEKNSIPMLKQYSKTSPTESERDSQYVAGIDQYLKYSYAKTIFMTDVDDNEILSKFKMDIFPNPVSDIARVRVSYEGKPIQAEVAIFDLLGQKVVVLSNDNMVYGTHNFDYNVSSLTSGTYYVTVSVGDKKFTKLMNIIK